MKIFIYIDMYFYIIDLYTHIICDFGCDVWGSSIQKSYSVDQAVDYLQRRCEKKIQIAQYRNTRGYSHVSQKWSSQVWILSTCKCVFNFSIYLCLSCIHVSHTHNSYRNMNVNIALYNFRTSELVGLYVAWVYNPPALKSTETLVYHTPILTFGMTGAWLHVGQSSSQQNCSTSCKIIMLDFVTLSWKIVEIDDGLIQGYLSQVHPPWNQQFAKRKVVFHNFSEASR